MGLAQALILRRIFSEVIEFVLFEFLFWALVTVEWVVEFVTKVAWIFVGQNFARNFVAKNVERNFAKNAVAVRD